MPNKLLVLGPKLSVRTEKIGGAIVLFENLIHELERNKIDFTLIDTNKDNYSSARLSYLSIAFQIIKLFRKANVVFLNSSKDYIIFLPLIILLNLRRKKKIYLRKFGGEIGSDLNKPVKGTVIKTLLHHIDGLFVETKHLYSLFKGLNYKAYWFPNVRAGNMGNGNVQAPFSKKFIFISQVKENKGINELVAAFKELKDCHLDIYGPLSIENFKESISGISNIVYKGTIQPQNIYNILSASDVLVLPTYYPGEGYPGIIIEAYACGKPVITTNWRFIPEIVEDTRTGFLIEPKSMMAIVDAVKRIDANNYSYLSRCAREKFHEFDSEMVTKKILAIIGV